jgi:hypothetical protein
LHGRRHKPFASGSIYKQSMSSVAAQLVPWEVPRPEAVHIPGRAYRASLAGDTDRDYEARALEAGRGSSTLLVHTGQAVEGRCTDLGLGTGGPTVAAGEGGNLRLVDQAVDNRW